MKPAILVCRRIFPEVLERLRRHFEVEANDADANWIPALDSLLAVRGNRWLTVTISVPGHSDRRLRNEAAALARTGFRLTAIG